MKRKIPIIILLVASFLVPVIFATAQSAEANVSLVKASNFNFANPNTDFSYTITVTNNSLVPLRDIVVTDTWPTIFKLNGQDGGFVAWPITLINPGESASRAFVVTVPTSVTPGGYISKTTFISQNPLTQKSLDYSLDIRQVAVLSSALPSTGGFDLVYFFGAAIVIQLSVLATLSWHKYNRIS